MINNFSPEDVAAELGFSSNMYPVLIVAIGEPAEKVVLLEANDPNNIKYYRDENDVHYVPKRKLEDIIISHQK
jgi:hypothetical protein